MAPTVIAESRPTPTSRENGSPAALIANEIEPLKLKRGWLWPGIEISVEMAPITSGTTSGAAPSTVITVDASDIGNAILSTQLGSNLDVFAGASTQLPDAGVEYTAPLLTGLGIQTVRWPGGADADYYHWETNTACAGGSAQPNNDFESFMLQTGRPANLQVVMTVNYGSNQTCDGGGDPAEAAAWVARARDAGYNVHYWTVGNEDYHAKPPDGGEFDLHARPHDPTTYAAAVAGDAGYYARMKAADPTAQVGVIAQPGNSTRSARVSV